VETESEGMGHAGFFFSKNGCLTVDIKDYLENNDLPLKALLLLDNAPGHPKDLEDNLLTDFPWLRVQFLPPNTTSLIQPMDQEVIAGFKKLYTRVLFLFRLMSSNNMASKY
jgi:hypothetical protein